MLNANRWALKWYKVRIYPEVSNRKKYLCPEERGITTPTTFFLVSFKQQKTPHHGNTKKRMLAANFTRILEAFQPRVYPRTNSLLSIT